MILKNLIPLIKQDIKFQIRHGFYTVYFIISIIYIALLKLLGNACNIIAPLIIFSDPTFIGFFFVGAIIFFEKEQKVTDALFVTPVSFGDYILAKAISLTILSLLVVSLISFAIFGLKFNWILLATGVILSSSLFVFLGLFLTNIFKNVLSYLIVGGLIMAPLCLPVLGYFNLINSWLLYFIPTNPSLKLITGAFSLNISLIDILYSFAYLLILNILSYRFLLKTKEEI